MPPEQAQVVIEGLDWLPWLLIFPACALMWARQTRLAGLCAAAAGYVIAAAVGQISGAAMIAVLGLAAAGWAALQDSRPWLRIGGHVLFVVIAIALRLHVAPGFNNPLAIAGAVTPDAVGYRAYLNLDKTLSAIWIVAIIGWLHYGRRGVAGQLESAAIGAAAFLWLAVVALWGGVVAIDPKLPSLTWLWALNNILLVCFAEEVFFRGYVQHGIERLVPNRRAAPWVAVGTASALFGLAHFGQGLPMVLLSMLAGVAYGVAYRRAGLPGAIVAHATLNVAHFLLLTYPVLR